MGLARYPQEYRFRICGTEKENGRRKKRNELFSGHAAILRVPLRAIESLAYVRFGPKPDGVSAGSQVRFAAQSGR
jgi:hypothetical protein